jgi:hypothetical protein
MAALFVDEYDFFYAPYNVPNQNEKVSFQTYLGVKEEEILLKLFGYKLWDEFKAAIQAGSPAQKWIDLRDGDTYTYGGETYKYYGLNDLLVPVIYSWWLKDNFDKHTNVGIGLNTKDPDFTLISPATRISRAYNKFSEKVGSVTVYKNTLWGFLKANEDTYTNWDEFEDFEEPGTLNIFNI